MEAIKSCTIKKEGLTISSDVLKKAGIEGDVDIFTRDHTIVIRSKYMTDKVRGIVKNTPLTIENLDELYYSSKGA